MYTSKELIPQETKCVPLIILKATTVFIYYIKEYLNNWKLEKHFFVYLKKSSCLTLIHNYFYALKEISLLPLIAAFF